ncbi:MAG: hypothetical protein FJZ04_02335 [Candidatus Moranbacteria bacterium]|nr:hypothetical protein [Candidatus Moranbacteria bacterium]
MLFRLYPFLTTLLFIGLIFFTLYFFGSNFVWWVLGGGAVIILFLVKKSVGRIASTIVPLLLIGGSLPVLSLMGTPSLRYFSIVLLSVSLYLVLLIKGRLNDNPVDKIALAMLSGVNFLTFFVLANLLFASFIHFSEIVFPVWLMIILAALISYIIAKDTLENNLFLPLKRGELTKKDINAASLLAALMTSEIAWGLVFFPFRYRSNAVLLLAAYYIFFTATQFFLTKEEKRRKLAKDIVIVLIAVGLILLTSKWRYY